MRKMKVLFLCTGNSARSQMAEAFLRKYAGDRFEVYRAGLEPKRINPYTVRVMEEAGIPLDGHRSKALSEYMGQEPVKKDDADKRGGVQDEFGTAWWIATKVE